MKFNEECQRAAIYYMFGHALSSEYLNLNLFENLVKFLGLNSNEEEAICMERCPTGYVPVVTESYDYFPCAYLTVKLSFYLILMTQM